VPQAMAVTSVPEINSFIRIKARLYTALNFIHYNSEVT
jgi:hypothetical protein